jgi:hypothetical protein
MAENNKLARNSQLAETSSIKVLYSHRKEFVVVCGNIADRMCSPGSHQAAVFIGGAAIPRRSS